MSENARRTRPATGMVVAGLVVLEALLMLWASTGASGLVGGASAFASSAGARAEEPLSPVAAMGAAGGPVLAVMASAGILVAASAPRAGARSVRVLTALLAVCALVYPMLLALHASAASAVVDEGPAALSVIEPLAFSAHLPPLVLLQVLPLVAARRVGVAAGASARGGATDGVTPPLPRAWLTIVLACHAASIALGMVARAFGGPAAFGGTGFSLAFAGAVIAPLGAWTAVRGAAGVTRLRLLTIAVAATLGPLILGFCFTLSFTEVALGLSLGVEIALLFVGFSIAVAGTGRLVARGAAVDEERVPSARLLRAAVVATLVAGVVLVAVACAFMAIAAAVPTGIVALVGIGATLAIGLPLARWAARAVDPREQLRRELEGAGGADGSLRLRAQQALRRVAADPELVLLVRRGDGGWVDPLDGESPDGESPTAEARTGVVVLARQPAPESRGAAAPPGGRAVALAQPSDERAARRLRALGDCGALLRPAILEAEVAREQAAAAEAAARERERLSRDLHDGLQSRLLGIALNLQLGGRATDDAAARLLIDETVSALRGAADEARTLADGRVPDVLVRDGLSGALRELVGALEPYATLEVDAVRFAPEVEATGYFVVGEAVGNAIKHGRASRLRVSVAASGSASAGSAPVEATRLVGAEPRPRPEHGLGAGSADAGEAAASPASVTISIEDDGVGGADPRAGSGLRRLAERVAASGGVLVVREAVPHGTIVEAVLPCES